MRSIILALILLLQCTALYAEPVRIGTTYSPVQSEYLELDWKETYISTLDMGFDIIRLGAYWGRIEKEEGHYDFSRLDWQIKEARKKGVPVVLTVGMKAPRWPEYFIPAWVLDKARLSYGADVSKNEYLRKRVLIFIEKTVNRYKNEPIIKYWQVENEALNRMGEKNWFIGKDLLKKEIELVKALDKKNRPILLTTATYPNGFLRLMSRLTTPHDPIAENLELCDILGLNIYPAIGHKFWWMKFYFWTNRKERYRYFSKLLSYVKSKEKDAWIVEFQAEPWEPGELVHKGKERPPTGWPEAARESFGEFRSLGFDTIFLWGAEYWRFREVRHKDTEWNNMVSGLLKEE